MKGRVTTLLVTAVLASSACSGETNFDTAPLDSTDQQASYWIGLNLGSQLSDARDRLDRAAFMRGVEDALQSRDPAMSVDELQAALQTFGEEIEAEAAAARSGVADENAAAGAAYLEENGARDGVVVTESGLQYEVLREGEGASPTADNEVRLHYRGTLVDGTEFDSSYDGEPVVFPAGGLIPGFTEALLLMSEGAHFRVAIPSDIGYGPNGTGRDIGPNATLIFEIELFEVLEQ